jgi:hypothetical protein
MFQQICHFAHFYSLMQTFTLKVTLVMCLHPFNIFLFAKIWTKAKKDFEIDKGYLLMFSSSKIKNVYE